MTHPLVSIITPVYNGEKYLEETLLSVFSQTYKHWELIVVDDGSTTDACAKICQKYPDKLNYIRQENRGPNAARNEGIHRAKGEFVAFMDADDLWLTDKLEKQVSFYQLLMSRGIQAGLVYTKSLNIDDTGKVVGRSSLNQSGNIYNDLIYANIVGTPSSVMVHKNVFNQAGYFDESLRSWEDWELWIRISRKYEIHCLDEFLTRYRRTENAASRNTGLMASNVERIVEMIIRNEAGSLNKNKEAAENFRRFHRDEIRKAWKESARERFLLDSDARFFRQTVLRGYGKYGWLSSLRLTVYYLLSFISISWCKALMNMRRSS